MKTNGIFKMVKKASAYLGLNNNSDISDAASQIPDKYIGADADFTLVQGLVCTILVIDISGSMGYQDCNPSRLAAAITAAETFIRERAVISPQDLAGIVSFNTRGRIELPLTPVTSVETAAMVLQNLRSGGGTDLDAGLEAAWDILEPKIYEGISGRIIFLTDGQGGNPITRAKAIKKQNVLVETIGFAGNKNEVNEKLLRKIATTDANGFAHYWFFKDSSSLVNHYKELATGVMFRGHNK